MTPLSTVERLEALLAEIDAAEWALSEGAGLSELSDAEAGAYIFIRDHGQDLLRIASAVSADKADADDACDTLLNRLEGWGKAYPVDIFSEPTDEELQWLHATRPGLLDRISASMGRHIATMIEGDIANLRAARLTAEQGEGND